MSKIYVGIDNGCTGTIGIIGNGICEFCKTPSKKEQDYTKKQKNISRLDVVSFVSLFSKFNKNDLVFVLERPMINSLRFNSSIVAARCFESELSQIELMGCKHLFIDSKEWQKELLPNGCVGNKLKKASKDIGNRLFPQLESFKHPDRDGILIAEYARRKNL